MIEYPEVDIEHRHRLMQPTLEMSHCGRGEFSVSKRITISKRQLKARRLAQLEQDSLTLRFVLQLNGFCGSLQASRL